MTNSRQIKYVFVFHSFTDTTRDMAGYTDSLDGPSFPCPTPDWIVNGWELTVAATVSLFSPYEILICFFNHLLETGYDYHYYYGYLSSKYLNQKLADKSVK